MKACTLPRAGLAAKGSLRHLYTQIHLSILILGVSARKLFNFSVCLGTLNLNSFQPNKCWQLCGDTSGWSMVRYVHPKSTQAPVWAADTTTEYLEEYPGKAALRSKAQRRHDLLPGQASEAAYGAQLLAFADELHARPAGRLGTSYAMDYPTKQSRTKRVGAPKAALMTARPFESHSVYNDTYFRKNVAGKRFDPATNVNVSRNLYDPRENPWFGASVSHKDFPDWGRPHQAPRVNRERPLRKPVGFDAVTTQRADYQTPAKGPERRRRPKTVLVAGAPLSNATTYREQYEWSAAQAPPCTVGYLAEETLVHAAAEGADVQSDRLSATIRHHSDGSASAQPGSNAVRVSVVQPARTVVAAAGGTANPRRSMWRGPGSIVPQQLGPVETGKRMFREEDFQHIAPYAAGRDLSGQTIYRTEFKTPAKF